MQAIITSDYGGVEVLARQNLTKPAIANDEILVQVHACSVNPIDWKVRRGEFKLLTGRKPPKILGGDYAGLVAEVGGRISQVRPGDAVWGFVETFKRGTYAEFVKVKVMDCKASAQDLSVLKEMVEKGQLVPVIEKTYPLNQVQEAHTRSETGRVVGKLVLKVV